MFLGFAVFGFLAMGWFANRRFGGAFLALGLSAQFFIGIGLLCVLWPDSNSAGYVFLMLGAFLWLAAFAVRKEALKTQPYRRDGYRV